ncbi:MAG: ArnT family glycosyltransferase [Anaerolineales bacterium]
MARLPTILLGEMLGLAVYAWGRELYGPAPGLLSLFLYVMDPNLLAHARLITTDLFVAAGTVFTLYLFWRFARRRSVGRALAAALALGLAQVAKYTAIALFPLLVLLILIYDLPRLLRVGRRGRPLLGRYVGRSALLILLFLSVSLAVIYAAFLGEYTFLPLEDYAFRSPLLRAVQAGLAGADWIRVPVPSPYLKGLDGVMYWESSGVGYARFYLLGELRQGERFPGYFLIAVLLKTPLVTQVIFVLSLISLVRTWHGRRFVRGEQFLLLPFLLFSLYFNLVSRAQIGIRYVLLTLPLMHLISGRLALGLRFWPRAGRIALSLGLASIALSTLFYHPDYLAYFNEIVWDRRLAYRYLADSNLDWGQSDVFLQEYLAAHPEARLEPEEIGEGEVIVRVNNLVGITEDPDRYATLRESCTPLATIGHAYLLYRVPCGASGSDG